MSQSEIALHWRDAGDLAADIRARRVSAVEVVGTFLDRIEELDRHYHAFLHLVPRSEALALAGQADAAVARGEPTGLLHGLPIAVKDLMHVAGMPTTYGAGLPAEIARHDSLLAETLRKAGAIIIGKTNTPEQGLGTLTINTLGPPTRNPWDISRHAGGSSGGAGAALASGMLPIADGSDSGGSIRYPAALCNLVGLRPSPGRVPSGRTGNAWTPHGVLGPMARTARDAGLLLAAISGFDPRAPLSVEAPTRDYADIRPVDLAGLRVAWSPDLGGLPIDPDVRTVLAECRAQLVSLGCHVEDVALDMDRVDECWEIIEMFNFFASCGADVAQHRDRLRPDLVRNVEQGGALTASQIAWALAERTGIFRRTAALLERFDVLACPATPIVAPPIARDWVAEIDGTRFERYFDWQRCACRITMTAHPALSVPAGFSASGLPVGLQLVGRYRDEAGLLRQAAAIDAATGFARRHPPGLA
ncbi:amidase [soil metagenome]